MNNIQINIIMTDVFYCNYYYLKVFQFKFIWPDSFPPPSFSRYFPTPCQANFKFFLKKNPKSHYRNKTFQNQENNIKPCPKREETPSCNQKRSTQNNYRVLYILVNYSWKKSFDVISNIAMCIFIIEFHIIMIIYFIL